MAKQVQARFHVSEDKRVRGWSAGDIQHQFRLYGIKGEPFGSATPSANQDLLIANPEAAALFTEAFEKGLDIDVVYTIVEPAQETPEQYSHGS